MRSSLDNAVSTEPGVLHGLLETRGIDTLYMYSILPLIDPGPANARHLPEPPVDTDPEFCMASTRVTLPGGNTIDSLGVQWPGGRDKSRK